ncbi:NADH-quinone oxidoreductase subunit NuoI [Nitratifractor salsuginis]|uniref:NADH-quinone oxidoreductase subunit I n=1 Tax=Nitratifractor salsuginis (strain DSM 16511 / JCM 12458 / E9I37-1) TaxID=749222 RepID=E6WYR8_NITSE|nr:NADH-quinone oxidoreductase subunit NuoI [Nitratifractor salsuginis]ADV45439.1 NADH dehydrogenase subunit I [Nitratifractor salsuginis DSM 16511]
MSLEEFKNRNVGTQNYRMLDLEPTPESGWGRFKRVVRRSVQLELFTGLKVTFREMIKALFMGEMHTIKYPFEKLPIAPRYRAIHEMKRLLESGHYRCIGCGLCEKICIANCIRIDTRYDENQRKEVSEYTLNFGRCIFCGYCAEVCPELAIVHGGRYEVASEQRAEYALFEDMLTPLDQLANQKEYPGFGAVSPDADEKIKKTPLAY